tara:strand:+ start:211 stop:651 length:441 start_codon:yes stop_codon:yes gene_type:complete
MSITKKGEKMYDVNKKPLQKGNKVKVVKEIKYCGGPIIKVGTIGYVDAFTTETNPDEKSIQVKSKETKNGFIISGSYLEKIDPNDFENDLMDLFEDIIYQTEYMTGSWGDSAMLSQMAREDKISPWSIEEEVRKFKAKYNLTKKEK